MKNGVLNYIDEADIMNEAKGRMPYDMRNVFPKSMKKLMGDSSTIKGMLIIASDVILQGIKQGTFSVRTVTPKNAYIGVEKTRFVLLEIRSKKDRFYKIIDEDMVDSLCQYHWHYAKGEKNAYAYAYKNRSNKMILSRYIKDCQT